MAVKKGIFNEYVKARETSSLSSILKKRSEYTHNKVFDPVPSLTDLKETTKIKQQLAHIDEQPAVLEINKNGIQTVNKVGSELDTNGRQKKDSASTYGIQTVDKVGSELGTNDIQTVDKEAIQPSLSKLCGAQRKIAFAVYKNCRINGRDITQELSIDHLVSLTSLKKNTIKTSILRLKKKNLMFLAEYKDGRAGWSKYKLSKELFHEFLHNENNFNFSHNSIQTVNKVGSELGSQLGTTNTSSISINNITTTKHGTLLPKTWEQIDIALLEEIGFSTTQLKQLYQQSLKNPDISPESVQESIRHFAFGLEQKDGKSKYAQPLNVLMGVLRKGQTWIESAYQSPQEIAQSRLLEQKRLARERMKKMADEAFNLAFDTWQDTLSKSQIDELTQKRGREDITPAKVKLQSHFRESIWPGVKHEYLIENEE